MLDILQWPSQSPHLKLTEAGFHLLKAKLKIKHPPKQAESEGSRSKDLVVKSKKEVQHLVMSVASGVQAGSKQVLKCMIVFVQ